MNWNDRDNAKTKDEAIEALLDGISKGVKADDLEAYASIWTIPLSLQNRPTQTPVTPVSSPTSLPTSLPTVETDDEDDDWEDEDDYDDYDDEDDWY